MEGWLFGACVCAVCGDGGADVNDQDDRSMKHVPT